MVIKNKIKSTTWNNKNKMLCIFLIIVKVTAAYHFPEASVNFSVANLDRLNTLTDQDFQQAVELGISSYLQEIRLESHLIQSKVFVTNGSTSYAQFLETRPSNLARETDKIAKKILKSSLYVFHSKCSALKVDSNDCVEFISQINLPASSLRDECLNKTADEESSSFIYRRLLPAYYKDGLYKIFSVPDIPAPRNITLSLNNLNSKSRQIAEDEKDDMRRNIIFVQWSQFIEHDLSKSVVTTMSDGKAIECCNTEYTMLRPRYIHPACAPIEAKIPLNEYSSVSCFNYVRSALGLSENCTFGPAIQINQATASLDLSQLYGQFKSARIKMRKFKDGLLKTFATNNNDDYSFLPLAINPEDFCVTDKDTDTPCFMAGDSRANSSPYMGIIYTIFLRSHNRIAKKLILEFPTWNDEELFQEAKLRNIEIYRNIVFNEWLPTVIGTDLANNIKTESKCTDSINGRKVSNEFAVAASRFYYSMMPNSLHSQSEINPNVERGNYVDINSRPKTWNIFSLKDEFYKSDYILQTRQLDLALEAMLTQLAMKMDSIYVDGVAKNFLQTKDSLRWISGIDALAWDIQRGRDHGVASYTRYLELCTNDTINQWIDLEKYIPKNVLEMFKIIYGSYEKIDLIIGGISEIPLTGSTVGPTFACIIAEQFTKTKMLWNYEKTTRIAEFFEEDDIIKASKLLCDTTQLKMIPRDIFHVPSVKNPLVKCEKL